MTAPRDEAPGTPVRALLFDLGGVLIDYTGIEDLAAMLPQPLSHAEVRARLNACPHTQAFGVGRLGRDDYARRFVRDWLIDIDPVAFLDGFRASVRGWLPGAVELLTALRRRYRIAALSNTNDLHWERVMDDLGGRSLFDVAASSHEFGMSKPDPRVFHAMLDHLAMPPGAVAFFDDAPANVAAATDLGMRAFRVDGVDGVRQALTGANLI
jgi:putative hydrolase of the HAD superfamily